MKLTYSFKNYQISLNVYFVLMLLTMILLLPNDSFAVVGGNNVTSASDPIGAAMCNIYAMMQGTAAKVIGSVAVIFLAVGLFVGKISWGVAVATGVGIACMFGADKLVAVISGTGDADTCSQKITYLHQIYDYIHITINNSVS